LQIIKLLTTELDIHKGDREGKLVNQTELFRKIWIMKLFQEVFLILNNKRWMEVVTYRWRSFKHSSYRYCNPNKTSFRWIMWFKPWKVRTFQVLPNQWCLNRSLTKISQLHNLLKEVKLRRLDNNNINLTRLALEAAST
jgi:hypothetical protein